MFFPDIKTQKITISPRVNEFEKSSWAQSQLICGIDEVGRGCLAGPVVAAAVILKKKTICKLIKDSKLLSQKQLIQASVWINKNAYVGIGIVSHTIIDRLNIYQATLLAMNKAFHNLALSSRETPHAIIVDAMPLSLNHTTYQHIPIYYFNKGERYSISIAAASIIAKVTRDHIMENLNNSISGFSFESHKGYGTLKHQEALKKNGRSLIHRISFLSKTEQGNDNEYQQSIC